MTKPIPINKVPYALMSKLLSRKDDEDAKAFVDWASRVYENAQKVSHEANQLAVELHICKREVEILSVEDLDGGG